MELSLSCNVVVVSAMQVPSILQGCGHPADHTVPHRPAQVLGREACHIHSKPTTYAPLCGHVYTQEQYTMLMHGTGPCQWCQHMSCFDATALHRHKSAVFSILGSSYLGAIVACCGCKACMCCLLGVSCSVCIPCLLCFAVPLTLACCAL